MTKSRSERVVNAPAFTLHHGDCAIVLRDLPDASVDACVTDPPYGLEFMGQGWGSDVPPTAIWAEVLRVLKPGGWLLAFAGTRTQHRMATRIEDAGFEIRDMIAWVYGSGFPKSKNLDGDRDGWGTALKPALEPITVARKPLAGTVAANVARFGTGALNIDGCRVDGEGWKRPGSNAIGGVYGDFANDLPRRNDRGRWPANLIHDGSDDVLAAFPAAPGQQARVTGDEPTANGFSGAVAFGGMIGRVASREPRRDAGSAARFFYCAKASTADRDDGVSGEARQVVQYQTANGTSGKASSLSEGRDTKRRNHHQTVKPTDLMRYLCRLVTPPAGLVLDPFMGSGSTGRGAALEGFRFVGIEQDADFVRIAGERIAAAQKRADDASRQAVML